MARETPEAQVGNIVRHMNWRLMPFLLLMYVMAFLDRTNVGFAKDAFQASTGISNAAYAFGASVFFVGYAFLEVPSNVLLTRFGARVWLARIMITWGLVSAAMFMVQGETSFYILRMLLGVAEAGFFPGVIYYITQFYPEAYRARAMGLFYIGAPISFVLGGPVSGLLLLLDGAYGLHGWQWLFLVEGLLASAVGIAAFFYLSDTPEATRWLSTTEKSVLRARLDADRPVDNGHHNLLQALKQPIVLYLASIYFLVQMTVYGLIFFMPSQIAAVLGQKVGFEVGLISAIPWIVALIATIALPALADRTNKRTLLGTLLFIGASLGLAGSVMTTTPFPMIVSLSLAAASFIAVQPIFWAIASSRLSPRHASGAIALINSLGALGAFLAPNLRVAFEALFQSPRAGIFGLSTLALLGAVLLARLRSSYLAAANLNAR